jgi:hypothetical protein
VILAAPGAQNDADGRLVEMMRTAKLNAAVLVVCTLGLVAVASCQGERCPAANCALPPRFDLVVTESDSGGAGISTGDFSGVAFVLDSRRNKLVTTPPLALTRDRDPYKQFPGRSLFIFYPAELRNGRWVGLTGAYDVTATGGGKAPFTFHLVVGLLLPYKDQSPVAVNPGDVVVQEWNEACGDPTPPALAAPAFELVQGESSVTRTLVPASLQFTFKRRAYRALSLTGWSVLSATPSAGICVPDGFPRYPSMTSVGGMSSTCSWDIPTNDSEEHVLAFYKTQLNQGPWRIVSVDGSIISLRSDDVDHGVLTVFADGHVHLYIATGPYTTCL